jgi:hypothetical protein
MNIDDVRTIIYYEENRRRLTIQAIKATEPNTIFSGYWPSGG